MNHPSSSQIDALKDLIVPMADDAWMIGHQGSAWLGIAPDLEEDLAVSSINQDDMGHANRLYNLLYELGLASADFWIYERDALHWHHADLAGKPLAGWAEWVARRYFYETAGAVRRDALKHIPYPPLVASLKKMDREAVYHLAHYQTLMETLALGGPLSAGHLWAAVAEDWPLVADFFEWVGPEEAWASWDVAALAPSVMRARFLAVVRPDFSRWGMAGTLDLQPAPRRARHHDASTDLKDLLDQMRAVRGIAPSSQW